MSKKPIRSTSIKKGKKELQPSAISMTNITYLMRNSPKKLTEQEARLFLTQFQNKYPKDSIEVTKDGKILIKAKDGRITTRGIDGKPIIEKKPLISKRYISVTERVRTLKKDAYTGHLSEQVQAKEAKIVKDYATKTSTPKTFKKALEPTKYAPTKPTPKTFKALDSTKELKNTFTEKIGKSIVKEKEKEKEKKLTFMERIGLSKKKSK